MSAGGAGSGPGPGAAKTKECCAKCSQPYSLTKINPMKGRIPLVLPCGHSACENCLKNIIKFKEKLACSGCEIEFDYSAVDMKRVEEVLRSFYPVNLFLLGELTLQLSQEPTVQCNFQQDKQLPDAFIDVKAIIEAADSSGIKCRECKAPTHYQCKQCQYVFCDTCFDRIHCIHQCMQKHTKENISMASTISSCPVHSSRKLDYYCENCKRTICMDCMLLGEKTCFSHNIISLREKNTCIMYELKAVAIEVDETFRRLTKTALEVGNTLQLMSTDKESGSEMAVLSSAVRRHYSKLHALIQRQEEAKLQEIDAMKIQEVRALEETRAAVGESLKRLRELMNKLKCAADVDNIEKINIAALIVEAKETEEIGWFLRKVDNSDGKPLRLILKPETELLQLCELLKPEGETRIMYELLPTKNIPEGTELPPAPPKPVFPPTLPRDVREKDKKPEQPVKEAKNSKPSADFVPKFSQMGSRTSLNSLNSDVGPSSASTRLKKYRFTETPVQAVPPSQETTPKPLEEGSRELVYVTHIESPHDFFVQRACSQKRLKQMMAEFRTAKNFERPRPQQVIEGFILLGYCKLDNDKWRRCRVLSVDRENSKYFVFYIDYGQSDILSLDDLRLLAMPQMQIEPPFALHCSLANCKPTKGQWHYEDSVLMHQVINNKQLLMLVQRTLGASPKGLGLECDLTTWEHGVNILKVLVFHERAIFVDPKVKYPPLPQFHKPKLFFSIDVKKGTEVEVLITHIVNPEKFFVRKSLLQNQYEKLCNDLDEAYNLSNKTGRVYCPEVGMVVVANLDNYREQVSVGGWQRGVVKELVGGARVVVTLPDTGHEVLLHWTALRSIHERFLTMKALAMECYLSQMTPVHRKWSKSAVFLLESFTHRALQMYMTEENRITKTMGVVLYDNNDPDNVTCINTEFIKGKFAISDGSSVFEHLNTLKPLPNKVPPTKEPKQSNKPKPEKTILKRESTSNKTIKDEDLEVRKDRGAPKLEVKILLCKSPSQIYITFISHQEELDQLFDAIQVYYDKADLENKNDWKEGDVCCVLCKSSKTWRRAVIMKVGNNNAKVFYTDFALVEELPLVELRMLATQFTNVRDGAIKCHMSGIQPGGSDIWPNITSDYLKELLDDYNRFFITKKGEIKDRSLPIELWVYHVTPGGALEPDTGEWRRLNDMLVRQGLAIPDNSDGVADLSVEWLQLQSPQKEEIQSLSEDIEVYSETIRTCSQSPEPTVFKEWLKADPPANRDFIGMATFVNDNCIIILHDLAQEDTLDLIRMTLDARFIESDPEPQDRFWVVNQPCIVKYIIDNHYYRGIVTEVLDDCKCKVLFVDYGNVDVVPVKHMRKKAVMCQIPIQSLKCSLVGIQPVGGTWTTNTIEMIHKILVDKNCYVKVLNDLKQDILEVELKLGKQKVNDLLVECGLAYYSDLENAHLTDCHANGTEDTNSVTTIDSGPDYIVEDDNSSQIDTYNSVDWIKMMEEDDVSTGSEQFLTYPRFDLITDETNSFDCTVCNIFNVNQLQLSVIDTNEVELERYEEIFTQIQVEGDYQPVIKGVYHRAACIALYDEDGSWYRAEVMEQDPEKGLIRVRYVDFGNVDIVPVANVREIKESWCMVPTQVINAVLHNVNVRNKSDLKRIHTEYEKLFSEKRLVATVVEMKRHEVLVELRKDRNGPLLYQKLLDDGLLVQV